MGVVRSVRFSSNGQFLVVAEHEDIVYVYETNKSYETRQEIDIGGEILTEYETFYVGVWTELMQVCNSIKKGIDSGVSQRSPLLLDHLLLHDIQTDEYFLQGTKTKPAECGTYKTFLTRFQFSKEISTQSRQFFGEISGVSLSPDDETLYVGVLDRTYASLLQYNRRHKYGYLDAFV
ncbi:hypothetical protein Tco_1540735 [Tanacetum coccineum]